MIRPFHLRDLALVHRLSEQGVSLHTESALTDNVHPLRGALFSLFVGGDFPTYVWKAEQGDATGFIQLYLREDSNRAHILYLSSADPLAGNGANGGRHRVDETVWLPLLDQAVTEAGQRGIYSLVAEVSETGPELPVLRRAGFAVYTRQDIWVLNADKLPKGKRAKNLTLRRSTDDWEIQLLYANIVPRLVQLVEPSPPSLDGDVWVLREDGELTAFANIHDGSVATWLRLFVHPNTETQADEIVTAALQMKPPKVWHPVYCSVPRYQSWLQSGLERAGFVFWGSQAVMVKHTVHHLRKPLPDLATVLESQGIPASSPFVQRYDNPQPNGKIKVAKNAKKWRFIHFRKH